MDGADPYRIDGNAIADAPPGWLRRVLHCGPGLILSASIVGSGELIATTILGAKTGFIALWVILLSCLVKVAIQWEFGRHTIQTGETCVAALNELPGPRFRGVHWTIWFWILMQPAKILQLGGILGGVALVMHLVVPGIGLLAWSWITVGVVATLVSLGRYRLVESLSLVFLAGFTLATLISVGALQWTPYAFHASDLWSGLSGRLPPNVMVFVFAVFGLTGVGGDEIMHYSYWLIERGYAARTGPYRPNDEDWLRRANDWTRVMYLDTVLSMVAYTLVTAAFYVLGASVLHARGEVPGNDALIETLATIYTEALGGWGRGILLAGAFFVLFSSLFAALAAWSRMYVDVLGRLGWADFDDPARRRKGLFLWSWALAISWGVAYVGIGQPVTMIVWGGVATAAILLIVVFAAIHFRYWRTIPELIPSRLYDTVFWCSALSIAAFAIYGIVKLF